MESLRTAAQRYVGIALVPSPLLADAVIPSAMQVNGGVASFIGKLFAPLAAPTKAAIVTASVVGGAIVAPQAASTGLEMTGIVEPHSRQEAAASSGPHSGPVPDRNSARDVVADARLPEEMSREGGSAKLRVPDAPTDEIPTTDPAPLLGPVNEAADELNSALGATIDALPDPGLSLEVELPGLELPELELSVEVEPPNEAELPLDVEVPSDVALPLDDGLAADGELPVVDEPPEPEIVPTVGAAPQVDLPTAIPTLPPVLP
jgi:hypothetical protein